MKLQTAEFEILKLSFQRRPRLKLKVLSDSMMPLIPVGAEVEIVELKGNPQRFDIVVFHQAPDLICHYVWHRNELLEGARDPVFVTRSLSSAVDDLPVSQSSILGIVKNYRISWITKLKIMLKALQI